MNYNFDKIISRKGTNCIKYDELGTIFGREDLIPMWVADMDFKPPTFVTKAVQKRAEHSILGYTLRPDSYYEAIINWNKKCHGWTIQKEWISNSPGVVPAVNMAILAFSNPGDNIILQTPIYFPFFDAVKLNNRKILNNPLKLENGRYKMDFVDLKKKINSKTKMILLSSPHNPGGNVWKREELKELGDICKENNIIILSDEIHNDLIFNGNTHTPTASISEEIAEITLTCMAPSKTFNLAGLSTAYVIASNKEILNKYNAEVEKLHLGMGNTFGITALEAAYNHGEEWLKQLLQYLQENVNTVDSFFKKELPQVKIIIPEATYLIWIDFRDTNIEPDKLNAIFINHAKVAITDGRMYGEEGKGFFRMNIACPKSVVETALKRIKTAILSQMK
ncbi:MAG: PatB family C-S lyase [Bacteroidota bacterium]|nr:PatB family C-S lyase [Bacteroidota bacterium]